MNKQFQTHELVLNSFENLAQDLKLLKSEDPYAINLISSIENEVYILDADEIKTRRVQGG